MMRVPFERCATSRSWCTKKCDSQGLRPAPPESMPSAKITSCKPLPSTDPLGAHLDYFRIVGHPEVAISILTSNDTCPTLSLLSLRPSSLVRRPTPPIVQRHPPLANNIGLRHPNSALKKAKGPQIVSPFPERDHSDPSYNWRRKYSTALIYGQEFPGR